MEVIQFVTSVLIIAFFVGMIRPSWVRVDSRVKVLVYYFVPVIILIGVFGEDPNAKNEQNMTIEQAKREIAKLKQSKAELEQEANETIAELEEEKNESVTELQKEVSELKAKEAEKQPIIGEVKDKSYPPMTKKEWKTLDYENKLNVVQSFVLLYPSIRNTIIGENSLIAFSISIKKCVDENIGSQHDFDNIVNTCIYISPEMQNR